MCVFACLYCLVLWFWVLFCACCCCCSLTYTVNGLIFNISNIYMTKCKSVITLKHRWYVRYVIIFIHGYSSICEIKPFCDSRVSNDYLICWTSTTTWFNIYHISKVKNGNIIHLIRFQYILTRWAKLYWNIIWKIHVFVPFLAKLTNFWPK